MLSDSDTCIIFTSISGSTTKNNTKAQSSPSKVTRRSVQSPQKSASTPMPRGRKPGRGKPPALSAVLRKGRSQDIPVTKNTSHKENLKKRKKGLKPGRKVSKHVYLQICWPEMSWFSWVVLYCLQFVKSYFSLFFQLLLNTCALIAAVH